MSTSNYDLSSFKSKKLSNENTETLRIKRKRGGGGREEKGMRGKGRKEVKGRSRQG